MSEIRYCYHCHRGQPTITQPSGFATCATCGTDELGEVVDPALTGGRSPGLGHAPAVPPVRYVTTTETARSEVIEYKPAPLLEGEFWHTCVGCKLDKPCRRISDTFYLCADCSEPKEGDPPPAPRTYADIAKQIANMVTMKQAAYGDSFGKAGGVLAILYPAGIPVEAYGDALAIVRVLDKLFRIATDRDALGESPWRDIAGYALLAVRRVEQDTTKKGHNA